MRQGDQEWLAPQSNGGGSDSMMVILISLRFQLLDRTSLFAVIGKEGTPTGGNML